MIKKPFIVLFLTGIFSFSYGQTGEDSLLQYINSLRGVEKVDALNHAVENLALKNLFLSDELTKQALSLSDSLAYLEGRIYALKNEGYLAYLKGDLLHAIKVLNDALRFSEQAEQSGIIHQVYRLLAQAYRETNALDRSLIYFQMAYQLNEQYGDTTNMALALLGSAEVYLLMEQPQFAVDEYNRALKLLKRKQNIAGQVQALVGLADVYHFMEEEALAYSYFEQAESLLEEIYQPEISMHYYERRAALYQSSDPDSAIFYIRKAIDLADVTGKLYMKRDWLKYLSDLYVKHGDYEKAHEINQQYNQLHDSLLIKDSFYEPAGANQRMSDLQIEEDIGHQMQQNNPDSLTNTSIFTMIMVMAGASVFLVFLVYYLLNRYRFQKKSLANIYKLEEEIQTLKEEIQKKEQHMMILKEQEENIKKQNQSLRQMISGNEEEEHPIDRIQEISRKVALNTGSNFVSVWVYNDKENKIYCFDEYDRFRDIHRSGGEYNMDHLPLYFEALTNTPMIDADNSRQDPRTMELLTNRLVSKEIFSKLDIPLKSNNQLIGILWVERTGPVKPWSEEDKKFSIAISDLLTQIVKNKLIPDSPKKAKETPEDDSLAINQGRYDKIIHELAMPMILIDHMFKIVMVNNALCKMMGYEEHQLAGQDLDIVFPGQAMVNLEMYARIEELVNQGSAPFGKMAGGMLVGKSNQEHTVNLTVGSHRWKDAYYISILIFPSLVKEEVSQNMDEAIIHDEDLEMFYQTLPVNHKRFLHAVFNIHLLSIYHELADNGLKGDVQRAHFQIPQISGALTWQTIDLKSMLTALINLESLSGRGKIKFHIEVDHSDILLHSKETGWYMLYIILKNAFESIREEGDIYIKAFLSDNTQIIRIIDTGEGIASDLKNKIFKPFFTTKTKSTHYGLGLPLVREILRLHKGKIKINSKYGKGTEVWMEIPVFNKEEI